MKKVIYAVAVLLSLFGLTGCTDGQIGKLSAYYGSADIVCYSGGLMIYKGTSTGAVTSEASSDGYFFVEQSDGLLKEVSGNCVISYKEY